MPVEYKYLTPEQREFFFKHGWLKIEGGINKKYVDEWMADYWTRIGYDEHDPTTWTDEYVKLPRHRDVPTAEFCPDAYKAICDIIGGEDRLHPVRNTTQGDQFIVNNGSAYWETHDYSPQIARGWHTDGDWFRQFLDSGNIALTIIHLFTDIEPRGGGTYVCEDGIAGVVKNFYDHPEGLDPPYDWVVAHVKDCKVFTEVTGKAGDTFITHAHLPHTQSMNHTRKPRVISNPHVTLAEPLNFDRDDPSDYSLVEQVILDRLGKKRIPKSEYSPTTKRRLYFPRNYTYKEARVPEELERMIAAAKAKGLGPESIDSVYQRGGKELEEFRKRNGLDAEPGPNQFAPGTKKHYAMELKRAED